MANYNRGPDHPRWKGGHLNKRTGYRMVRNQGRLTYEHRVVMERILGRPLERHEIVHHRNGDRADNRPENLELLTQSAHMKHHHAHGGMSKPPVAKPMPLDEALILRLHTEGVTQKDIATQLGVSRWTIMRRMRDLGIPTQYQR